MITHSREYRPKTRDAWWAALEEGDLWAKANGWLLSTAWGIMPVKHGEGNWSLGFLSVVATEMEIGDENNA